MSVDHPYDTPIGSAGESSSSTSAKDQAQQAAGTAADESKHVAGVAKDEAQRVASEAQTQVTHLLDQATTQVEEQSRTQRDRLVDTLQSVGDDLEKMATQTDQGIASNLAREAADRVRGLSSRIDGREPRDLLDEVRSYARRKPGTFLLGALAAGVVAGRLTRGAKDARNGSSSSGATYGGTAPVAVQPAGYGTSAGTPLAGTGVPESTPVYPDADAGLPNPAGSVAGDTTWAETRSTGGLS
ncbi:hypothetical protein KRR39_20425 [Nocardioides panacis]|uniref:DUF3618 domain-containing protein n=1 Tax=Nocardioides panacis TaxID=2849501 RepID=A0A975XZS2_9ACTN|nr:hypothetical protein [Nocardioides panacis]QWZ07731.1 hypothetical protein KRR39_20425 [Nocardioides panacis]